MALGASAAGVIGIFLRDGMRLTLIGLVIGGALAAGVSVLVSSVMVGVQPFDPIVIGAVTVVLAGVTFLATLIPSRRATRLNPGVVLRSS
jgi:ABC-type lipoprotein release transport system permease subunit